MEALGRSYGRTTRSRTPYSRKAAAENNDKKLAGALKSIIDAEPNHHLGIAEASDSCLLGGLHNFIEARIIKAKLYVADTDNITEQTAAYLTSKMHKLPPVSKYLKTDTTVR